MSQVISELENEGGPHSHGRGRRNTWSSNERILPVSRIPRRSLYAFDSDIISEFGIIQNEIENNVDDLDKQFAEREAFEKAYYSITALATSIVAANENGNAASSAASSSALSQVNTSSQRSVKLPVIPIPKFNGDIKNWLEFRETYESLIHNNTSIDVIEKFHYLRASLEDTAAQVIKSIDFTTDNYSTAWQALCERFNNKRLLIHNHVKALYELEPITKESADKIRKILVTLYKHLKALETLGQPVGSWDTLLIYNLEQKLDRSTMNEWQKYKFNNDVPTLADIKTFLNGRANLLETIELGRNDRHQRPNTFSNHTKSFFTKDIKCSLCKANHFIFNCQEFHKQNVNDRIKCAQNLRLCLNCLRAGHSTSACRSSYYCKKFNLKHNTALHRERDRTTVQQENHTGSEHPDESITSHCGVVSLSAFNTNRRVLLSTAKIEIFDKHNKAHHSRALLDSGSQSSFISTELINKLQLNKERVNISVSGLNHVVSEIKSKCQVKMQSCNSKFNTVLSCLVLSEINGILPNSFVDISMMNIPEHLMLADPNFNEPQKIDILIGADSFWDIIGSKQIHLGNNMPIIRESKLGWIISGPIVSNFADTIHCNFSKTVQTQLAKFWEIEEGYLEKPPLSHEENTCEEHFIKTTKRDSDGRFIVSIPFRESLSNLGDSRKLAEKRFFALERKFQWNSNLKHEYVKFMNDYQALSHMTPVDENENASFTYYMPHHGVIREDSLTTKLRTVFDASAPTTSGYSLNDLQMTGPTIQSDIISIILRFRKHKFVVTADITKMYRQVLIKPNQRPLQKIVWRGDPSQPLIAYNLNTVTYGFKIGSFLAIRCLVELANEAIKTEPDIAKIIKDDFYVDDFISGGETIAEVSRIVLRVSAILKGGCFDLRKWHTNDERVLEHVEVQNDPLKIIKISENENSKMLGLSWNSQLDNFVYDIQPIPYQTRTKRSILSTIAKLFDPLGLLSAFIITAKIIMQKIWLSKLSWDEPLPASIESAWLRFIEDLPLLNNLRIPRWVICDKVLDVQVHGFSDASINAYGACIYIRSVNKASEVYVNLLCAKSKVAPLKCMTVPRLELCGALILARLIKKVKESLQLDSDIRYTYWTDSTVVLGWLKASPSSLKQFVSNRIAEIQELTHEHIWRHVPTRENPADMLSRGISPTQLLENEMWLHGPNWLSQDENLWPRANLLDRELPEKKTELKTFTIKESLKPFSLEQFSNLTRLKHVTAYILRFTSNCRVKRELRQIGPLTLNEISNGFVKLIKISQQETFGADIGCIKAGNTLERRSKLLKLNPFLSADDNLLRVGGRLENSTFDFNKKHPIVLSADHHLSKLIFRDEHIKLLHAPPQLLLSNIRERFWPLRGRELARKTVHGCVRCFRVKPSSIQPQMGQLPATRVLPGFPFSVTGIDYAGPLSMKDRKTRGCKILKCYLALFVCFSTKAVHLELVTALTTESFLLALNRFVSRRGKPLKIYSDNGTNFTGAYAELKSLSDFLKENDDSIIQNMREREIEWEFIPPHSPHFGGLWEAGVKSAKSHLKRVLGRTLLTFEELYTLLAQIESILNSRPLSPLSSHPTDLNPLTPAHFLIGRHPAALPSEDLRDVKASRLSNYQHIQQMANHFWTRWQKEYISELQQRTKWYASRGHTKVGDLVILREDNTPPLQWRIGRILELHPGKDGISRVATIHTSKGTAKRPICKLCPLPIEGQEDSWLKRDSSGRAACCGM